MLDIKSLSSKLLMVQYFMSIYGVVVFESLLVSEQLQMTTRRSMGKEEQALTNVNGSRYFQ